MKNRTTSPVGRRRSRRLVTLLALPALAGTLLVGMGAGPATAAASPTVTKNPVPAPRGWQPKTPPMTTPWTNAVSTTQPLPEYPRPQLTRSDWQNLNGIWDFAVTANTVTAPPSTFGEQIRVPFVAESALSGIQRKITQGDRLWYRRTFTVPAGWRGRQVQLNFGAVDWQTDVWVNGARAGTTHRGGYDAFGYDITPLLRAGTNTLVVGVWDPTEAGGQAIGKQRIQEVTPHSGNSILYTAASGIWQTVWLEPTPAAHLTRLDLTPDLATGSLLVTASGSGVSGETVTATVSAGGKVVATGSGAVGRRFAVAIRDPHLWSPKDPFLYDVRVNLTRQRSVVDSVGSYAGMRSIAVAAVDGVMRPVLNGSFVFQTGTLDQGYWPDGIYTAPTDEALKFDLQAHRELGFTMVRKHIKVEPQRWFYWADRLGLLVWQDMPSMGRTPNAEDRTQWEAEFHRIIDQHRSSPALVQYVDQNEGWGQYDQARIASEVKAYDPTRLVDNMSGVNCCGAVDGGNGDVIDNHNYVGPGLAVPSSTRAAVVGEFGGLGWKVPGHEWFPGGGFSYEDQTGTATLTDRVVGLYQQLRTSGMPRGISASVYTEITDVENEVNGFLTYDRQVYKVDVPRVRAANEALVAASPTRTPVTLPTGTLRSLQVTTPGFTDRYVRHQNSLGFTEVVAAGSDDLLKKDATWKIVPGLADAACYSFQSFNYPDRYLRHREFRVRIDTDDGSPLLRADATWCPEPAPGGMKLSAYNFPGQYLRHINAELWLAAPGDDHAWDAPASFDADTTWSLSAPWAG